MLMRYLFSFQGRLSRGQYWRRFWGLAIACGVVMIAAVLFQLPFWMQAGAMMITMLVAAFSWTSMSVRRAHDLGKPGRWLLYSPFRAYQLTFREGEPQTNQYGPAPQAEPGSYRQAR